jgi:hypothetical protein
MKDKTELNEFILSMGTTTKKIPIVYPQGSHNIAIQKDNQILDRKSRYGLGKDVMFRCPKCKDILGKGKFTNEEEDRVKIFCFKCNEYFEFEKSINWQKETLWYKPENNEQRIEFERLSDNFIKENNPLIIER